MTEQTKTRIPAPLYAAAGAGDLAYEQLRKLPAVVTELRGKANVNTADLRERAAATLKAANATVVELREKAVANELDLDRVREAARRNAQTVLTEAKAAQARAAEVYHELITRGERVVGTGVVQAADTVNSDIEATEAPGELTATPADVAAVVDAAAKPNSTAKGQGGTAKPDAAKPAKAASKRTRPNTDK
jgi:hypothetical protein